jgi:hypothetical protein
MASYSVPQFLDSGESIVFGLNMRQLGYAFGGFLVGSLIFSVATPFLGLWGSLIPIAPVAGLALYLAFGKYNGRPSEVYVLKMILFNVKPRALVYSRIPEIDDLNKKMAELTQDKILNRWKLAVSQKIDTGEHQADDTLTAQARKIRQLASIIDTTSTNTLSKVRNNEMIINEKETILKSLIAQKQSQQQKK